MRIFQRESNISYKELSVFCRMMSVVIISQLPLTEGLKLVSEQMANKNLSAAVNEIYKLMETGRTFSQAIGAYPRIFGSYAVNMIEIGEASGTLDEILGRLAVYFDKEDNLRRKLKSALSYPLALTVLMAAIIALLIVKILPMFEATLDSMGGELPDAAFNIFMVSGAIRRYAPAIIGVIAAAVILAALYFRTKKGRMVKDRLKITAPGFRYVNSRIITSRYARGLSILLRSGVQLLNAMSEIVKLINNAYLENRFYEAVDRVREGEGIDSVLNDLRIFPPLFVRLVKIGHSAGHLDEMLERSAVIFDEEVDYAIDQVTQTVEPALIIVLSVVVGVILLSVMLPMIGIMNAIG